MMTEQGTTQCDRPDQEVVRIDGTDGELTTDAFLGGQLKLLQPKRGYRAGLDAVLLAASVPIQETEQPRVLDCGAGIGTVGLCIAACHSTADVVLLERDPQVLALAKHNIARNGLDQRVRVVSCDLTEPGDALGQAGINDNAFSHIVANPPFFDIGAGTASPHALKAAGHAMPPGDLDSWMKFAARMARPGGQLSMIQHSAALPALLAALQGRFGLIQVVPVFARDGQAANRVLISAVKGSRGPFTLRPGLVLQDHHGRYKQPIEAVLRRGAPLAIF